jgi:hypothetical protein
MEVRRRSRRCGAESESEEMKALGERFASGWGSVVL